MPFWLNNTPGKFQSSVYIFSSCTRLKLEMVYLEENILWKRLKKISTILGRFWSFFGNISIGRQFATQSGLLGEICYLDMHGVNTSVQFILEDGFQIIFFENRRSVYCGHLFVDWKSFGKQHRVCLDAGFQIEFFFGLASSISKKPVNETQKFWNTAWTK